MLKRLWVAVLAAGLVGGFAAAADEAVTIKVKKMAKGDVVKETKSEENEFTVSAGGQQVKKGTVVSKAVYTEEVLEKGEKDAKPTKLKRTYEKLEVKGGDADVDPGLEGKTVLIEKGKDKYTFTIDGKAVAGDGEKLLDKEFNKKDAPDVEELLLPKKAVKVGDTWAVDSKVTAGMFGEEMGFDTDKVKVTGKLTKVYDKDKAKWGVMEYTFDVPVSSVKTPMGDLDTTAGSKLKLTITLDTCIDGSTFGGTSNGTVDGEVGMKVGGMEVEMKLGGKMSSKSEPGKK